MIPSFCEVVVNRPIVRKRIVAGLVSQETALDHGDDPLAVTFSYAIPETLRAEVALGQLVEVPFRDESLQAVIVGLSDRPPPDLAVRPLSSILETEPVVSGDHLRLASWLSARYLAPLSDCVWLFLPPGSRRLPQQMVEAVECQMPLPDLDARAAALYLYLTTHGPTPANELEAVPLNVLSHMRLVRSWKRLSPPRVGPQVDRTVELIAGPEEVSAALPFLGHASKKADVLLHLDSLDDPFPAVSDVLSAVGCGAGVLAGLAERGWVELRPRRNLVGTAMSGIAAEAALDGLTRAPAQQAALRRLLDNPGPIPVSDVEASSATLAALEKKGYCQRWTESDSVSLGLDREQLLPVVFELRGSNVHKEVLDMLSQEEGRVWVGWVYVQTRARLDTLRGLAEAGLVSLDEARRWRDPLRDRSFVLESPPTLIPEQAAAWEAIRGHMAGLAARPASNDSGAAFLLHGVTGSGKTEIYLRAVAEALERGRGAIILVPEIALAAQTIQRVAARFPGKVAVWHSDLSLGERFDTWQRIRDGELPIVVGARSALFAPVRDLGLIVVDEEHEPAYKQARTPRYHAREVALELGRLCGAVVILGSATPDVSSYRRAERGELILLRLPQRVLAHRRHLAGLGRMGKTRWQPVREDGDLCTLPLPSVEVVGLSEELKAGNLSMFSRALQQAMRETLAADQQAILFLNRRGSATFVLCRDCGHVMSCPSCQVPLTFHAAGESLVCHHCNRRQENPDRCPVCHSSLIRYFGLGTERVEEVVQQMFPQARTLRWDRDTARARGSHEAFLQHFVEGRANVLIGTQMIAKGLDMPRVTLVGVVSADTALYMPDFRAAERTFQLLTQVAGRAGRSSLGGRVIIQSYNPDLSVIRAAADQDYARFYQNELVARRDGRYPPFKRLARLTYLGTGEDRARAEAERMAGWLKDHLARLGEPGVGIIGPAPCFYYKLRGRFRWHIMIRSDRPEELLRPLTQPPGWRVDVDPIDLL